MDDIDKAIREALKMRDAGQAGPLPAKLNDALDFTAGAVLPLMDVLGRLGDSFEVPELYPLLGVLDGAAGFIKGTATWKALNSQGVFDAQRVRLDALAADDLERAVQDCWANLLGGLVGAQDDAGKVEQTVTVWLPLLVRTLKLHKPL